MSVPDISISIVALDKGEFLVDCLNSLFNTPASVSFEVYVIINASSDGTIDLLKEKFPQVHLISLAQDEGFTRSSNLGLQAGRGRYLMPLNPDILVQPGMLDILVQFMDNHPEAGICTPKALDSNGTTLQRQYRRSAARFWDVISYFANLSRLFPTSRLFRRYLITSIDESLTYAVEAGPGSCMLIRRNVLEQIGYFDENLFPYQEETDFCFRARQAKWKIYYIPQAHLIHCGGRGGSQVIRVTEVIQWYRCFYLFYRKNLARNYFFLLNWMTYLAMGAKLGLSLIKNALLKEKIVGTQKH